jgi:hypothetical protein
MGREDIYDRSLAIGLELLDDLGGAIGRPIVRDDNF